MVDDFGILLNSADDDKMYGNEIKDVMSSTVYRNSEGCKFTIRF